MSSQIHEFKVGVFDCAVIQDEDGTPTLKALFAGVDDPSVQQRIEADPEATEQLSYNLLLIDTGAQKILIDAGNGELTGGDGRLMPHLRQIGVSANEIDIVVLTHAHGDHYAGMLTPQGEKVFPNAVYMMWRDEWAFYTHPDQLKIVYEQGQERWAFIQRYFLPLYPHLSFLDAEGKGIAPGVAAIYAPGHTQHHIAVAVESEGEALLVVADAFVHPLYLENPTWQWERVLNRDRAIATNYVLIDWAVEHDAMILAYHFPFPGLGRVDRSGDSVRWLPVGGG